MSKFVAVILSVLTLFSSSCCAQTNFARLGKTAIDQDEFNAVLNYKRVMEDQIEKESFRSEITQVIEEYLAATILIDQAAKLNPVSIHQADLMAEARYRFMVASQLESELTMVYAEDLPKMRSPELDELVFKSLETQTIPEQRAKWSHIYLPFTDEAQKQEIEVLVQEIQTKLEAKVKFEDLIEEYSQEPNASSDQVFGPMEYHGKVLPLMAKTIDELNEDDVSGPVETEIGYFFIKLHYRSDPKQQLEDNTRVSIYRKLMAEKQKEKESDLLSELRSKYNVTFGSVDDDFYMKVGNHVVHDEDLEWYIKEGDDPNRPFQYDSISDKGLKTRLEKQELLFAYQMEVGKIPSEAMELLHFMIRHDERLKAALQALVSAPEVSEEEIEAELRKNPLPPVLGAKGLLFSINDAVLYEELKTRTAKKQIEYLTEFFELNRSLLASRPSELPPYFKPYTVENFHIENTSLLPVDLRTVFQETDVNSATPPVRGNGGWNTFFVYAKTETESSLESVKPAIRNKIALRNKVKAEEKYIQQIILDHKFEMLISFDDLIYSQEENGFLLKE